MFNLFLISLLLFMGLQPAPAQAITRSDGSTNGATGNTITVNTTDDDNTVNGNCTLREAILAANADVAMDNCPAGNGPDTISLPPGTYSLSIPGAGEDAAATGDLDITDDLIVMSQGEGSSIINGGGLDRVLHIFPSVHVTINGLTIENGNSGATEGGGIYNSGVLTLTTSTVANNTAQYWAGGIYNDSGGTMTLTTSTVRGNTVTDLPPSGCMGGGIYNKGTLVIESSTIAENSAYCAGGILNEGVLSMTNDTVSGNQTSFSGGIQSNGTASLINVTIANNSAGDFLGGGGIVGTATLENTIVANNMGGNCGSLITSLGHNLDSGSSCGFSLPGDITNTDPLLAPLYNNGGATSTHALTAHSPAVDAGDNGSCPSTDQRRVSRPIDGNGDSIAICDIGAYELKPPAHPIIVNTTNDELNTDGDCSLREAILAANTDLAVDNCPAGSDQDVIQLPAGTYPLSLTGAQEDGDMTGDLDIASNLTIKGAGATQTRIDGDLQDRVLQIMAGFTVEINDITIIHGHTPSGVMMPDGENGGGIHNAGTLVLNHCTIDGNFTGGGRPAGRYDPGGNGGNGGGIYNAGTLILNNSTVSRNFTGSGGGDGGDGSGIYNAGILKLNNTTISGNGTGAGGSDYFWGFPGGNGGSGGGLFNTGTLTLNNATISNNRTGPGGTGIFDNGGDGQGGGIYQGYGGGQTYVKNTILSGNLADATPSDCFGASLVSYGYNLVQAVDQCTLNGDLTGNLTGLDARLGSLADNGGNTLTQALHFNSPAVDAGTCTNIAHDWVATDQRGVLRPQAADCDIGAFELEMKIYLPILER